MRDKQKKDLIFHLRESDLLSRRLHRLQIRINRNISITHQLFFLLFLLLIHFIAADQRFHSGQQFHIRKWLYQIVIASCRKTKYFIMFS